MTSGFRTESNVKNQHDKCTENSSSCWRPTQEVSFSPCLELFCLLFCFWSHTLIFFFFFTIFEPRRECTLMSSSCSVRSGLFLPRRRIKHSQENLFSPYKGKWQDSFLHTWTSWYNTYWPLDGSIIQINTWTWTHWMTHTEWPTFAEVFEVVSLKSLIRSERQSHVFILSLIFFVPD